MARTGKSKTCVWRWQERFMHEGVDGLLRDRCRPGRQDADPIEACRRDCPPDASTAPARGDPLDGVRDGEVGWCCRVDGAGNQEGARPQPASWRSFKQSNDPAFAEKLTEIVGRYVDPPAHAVVLSFDEKSQIQALDRTQPGLPMKKGRAGTMTNDCKRHGTTRCSPRSTCGRTVIGQNMQRHRYQEFIRFLNRLGREVPADKAIHVILDNYAAHKKDKVQEWLARHPRWTFHFTPTSCSWLNAVEGFFAKLTRRRLKNGVFHSVVDLQAAINRFIREYNAAEPSPSSGEQIPTTSSPLDRGFQTLESIH
jgi:transposase